MTVDYNKFVLSEADGVATKDWGPYGWKFLHRLAEIFKPELTKPIKKILKSIAYTLPCCLCRDSFVIFVQTLSSEDLRSTESLERWLGYIHTTVDMKVVGKYKQRKPYCKNKIGCNVGTAESGECQQAQIAGEPCIWKYLYYMVLGYPKEITEDDLCNTVYKDRKKAIDYHARMKGMRKFFIGFSQIYGEIIGDPTETFSDDIKAELQMYGTTLSSRKELLEWLSEKQESLCGGVYTDYKQLALQSRVGVERTVKIENPPKTQIVTPTYHQTYAADIKSFRKKSREYRALRKNLRKNRH